ncbi:hypothetical protein HMPREF9123_2762 [Neisseria bacilliformis ATCC BAA-1200]|uniref:Uncharacterized protein n=1 Tax=Neisseria bacilliformis ATCC BAA-1200 TaxID=888742 RepID=F2BGA5_9NEIS|nr:hypothetical protein HMPREF9123_2762 [Neisseria bacilliformis ATCC BAA-1200]
MVQPRTQSLLHKPPRPFNPNRVRRLGRHTLPNGRGRLKKSFGAAKTRFHVLTSLKPTFRRPLRFARFVGWVSTHRLRDRHVAAIMAGQDPPYPNGRGRLKILKTVFQTASHCRPRLT